MPRSKIEQHLSNLRNSLDVAPVTCVGVESEQESVVEQSVHDAHFTKSTATSTRSKVDWDAIASGLAQKLDNTKQQINLLQKEIEVSQVRLRESEEALTLVANPLKWMPQQGEFELFDKLSEVVSQQKNEQQRIEKVEQARQAITLGQQLITQKQQQIIILESDLTETQQALIWVTKYGPRVADFEPGYAPTQAQQTEIRRYQRYVEDAQGMLDEARKLASGTPREVQQWIDTTVYSSADEAIATFEESLQRQKEALAKASKRDEAHFKRYIIARVDIAAPLERFLIAQEQYRQALEAFLPQIQQHGEALSLTRDEVDGLVNSKLPQIKNSDGRITLVL